MAICYFNRNYDESYNCEYQKISDGIEVIINYEIDEEIPLDSNGVRTFRNDTKFEKRDILIIDYNNKMNYLLKDAYYYGHTSVSGTPDGGFKTKFFSHCYLYHKNYNKLGNLLEMPKCKKIRIYSNVINELIGHPSLYEESLDNEFVIKLKNATIKKNIMINKNNIKTLTVSDDWHSTHSFKDNDIVIKLNGYIEIETLKKVNYNDVYNYIKELKIYLQLLRPVDFVINKATIFVDDVEYGFNLISEGKNYTNSNIENSVSDDLLIFLSKCYELIPYRNSKSEIRNIQYILLNTSRNLEDNFLMFYRFIECYYKRQKTKNIVNNFIKYSILNNYKYSVQMDDIKIETLAQEIICLRNHYVHSGYYIKNGCLRIKFKTEKNGKPNKKNYTVRNVNFDWIYDRTIILYKIVIDIIFSNMLGYNNYKFNKNF